MALSDNLQGHWKMEEASGTLIDETVNSNDLTVRGAPLYQQAGGAPVGSYSISYDGVDDSHVSGASPTGLVITGAMSVQAWIKNPSVDWPYANRQIVGRYNDVGGGRCWYLNTFTPRYMRFFISSDGSSGAVHPMAGIIFPQNVWKHIVVVYNGTDIRFYVDRALSTASPFPYTGGIYGGTTAFSIGSDQGETIPVKAYIDEVAIWNRAITPAEVSELYITGIGGNRPPNAPTGLSVSAT